MAQMRGALISYSMCYGVHETHNLYLYIVIQEMHLACFIGIMLAVKGKWNFELFTLFKSNIYVEYIVSLRQ